ncbi:M56 family metallopeptidase [Robinsoniella peoriensis]
MWISKISTYSLANAIIFFSVGLLVIKRLRRNTKFIVNNGITALMVLLMLSVIRVLLPLDFSYALVIPSDTVLPVIQKVTGFHIGSLTIGSIIMGIWCVGTSYILIKESYHILKTIYSIGKYRIIANEQAERVLKNDFASDKVCVFVSPDVDVPKVTGFIHARIYIPELKLSDHELRLILLHEVQHIRGGDTFIKLFYLLLKAAFWWNPIVRNFELEIENMLELRCDLASTKGMERNERVEYLEAILNVMKQTEPEKSVYSSHVSTLINERIGELTKQRFKVILERTLTRKIKFKIASMGIIISAFICSYLIIIQPVYFSFQNEAEGGIDLTTENAYILISRDNTIEIYVDGQKFTTVNEKDLDMSPLCDLTIHTEE